LGILEPGQQASTTPMSFTNPAPNPPRGQTAQVVISYQAWVYSSTLMGPDPAPAQRLLNRGIDPDTDVPQVDPGYMPTVLGTLDLMTSRAAPTDTAANQAALDAVKRAVNVGMLPELKAIVDSQRLVNPQDLAAKLREVQNTAPGGGQVDKIGYRREIEQAATILRHDPTARVILDGYVEEGADRYGADILDVTNKRAYQLKTVNSAALVGAVSQAVDQLNGRKGAAVQTGVVQKAPPGYTRIAQIYIEPMSKFHQRGRDDLVRFLRANASDLRLCVNGVPQADILIIANAAGVFQWTKDQFDVFGC
jgi:hypothetical protein